MAVRYRAVRACVYGPKGFHTLFNAGDLLPEGWKPGKHFAPEGEMPTEAELLVLGPGDDPRSTKKMAFDLKAKHEIELPAGASRRDIFAAWVEAEKDAEPVVAEPVIVEVDPLGTLKFADLTEKDIDAVLAKEIISSMEFRFGMDVKHAGKSKKQLVELGAELESKQAGARAP